MSISGSDGANAVQPLTEGHEGNEETQEPVKICGVVIRTFEPQVYIPRCGYTSPSDLAVQFFSSFPSLPYVMLFISLKYTQWISSLPWSHFLGHAQFLRGR